MIKEAISKAMNKENLTREEALQVMKEIMSGEAEQSQVAAFLVALHMKGETAEEISACAEGMRSFATKLDRGDMNVIDIVGTGGDRSNTFNISTTAAIVTAAAGVAVAKHGNRAASSKCGTADCLETLGVNLMLEPEKNAKVLKDTNLCFLFAQKYHPAMRYVGPVRKAIGVPTVFNILGPLTNPAYNTYQLLGVYSEELLSNMGHNSTCGTEHCMCPKAQAGPGDPALVNHEWCSSKAQINGTVAHITAIFGFTIAGMVMQDLYSKTQEEVDGK